MYYKKKYDFMLPHKERLIKMIEDSEKIMDEILSPKFEQPNETPKESSE
jgi:hypothetical protein